MKLSIKFSDDILDFLFRCIAPHFRFIAVHFRYSFILVVFNGVLTCTLYFAKYFANFEIEFSVIIIIVKKLCGLSYAYTDYFNEH